MLIVNVIGLIKNNQSEQRFFSVKSVSGYIMSEQFWKNLLELTVTFFQMLILLTCQLIYDLPASP